MDDETGDQYFTEYDQQSIIEFLAEFQLQCEEQDESIWMYSPYDLLAQYTAWRNIMENDPEIQRRMAEGEVLLALDREMEAHMHSLEED